jgi:fructokinase
MFGAIEFGGTKIVCAIGTCKKIKEKKVFKTSSPEENMDEIIEFFKKEKLLAIGIGCFGPIELDPHSSKYGLIANSVKPKWKNFNILKALKKAFSIPIALDTDVNVAALGEALFGAGKNVNTIVYWTIGTGIGAGVVISLKPYHGMIHPEMGHSFVFQEKNDDFRGVCPVHKNCLEGLASGPSLMKRWNLKQATDLPIKHKGWDLEAKYLALAMVNTIYSFSPDKIILGGGVMKNENLIVEIRKKTLKLLGGFFNDKRILDMDNYIVHAALKDNAGVIGAFALAKRTCNRK